MTNQIPAIPTNAHPTQSHGWELNPVSNSVEYINTYQTVTGYWVNVKTMHSSRCSYVEIVVSDETAFVIACRVSFYAYDHECTCEEFVANYLESPALEDICAHFDELCVEYDEEDVA